MVLSLSAVRVYCEETCRSSKIRGILKLCIADGQMGSDEKISLFAVGLLPALPALTLFPMQCWFFCQFFCPHLSVASSYRTTLQSRSESKSRVKDWNLLSLEFLFSSRPQSLVNKERNIGLWAVIWAVKTHFSLLKVSETETIIWFERKRRYVRC